MENLTFYELVQLWKRICLDRKSIEVRTKEEYLRILDNRVLPVFGKTFINDINAMMLDSYVGDLIDKGYAAKTIKNTMSIVGEIFKFAYRKDIILINPMDKMEELPQLTKSGALHYFTPREAKMFLTEVNKEGLEYRTIFYVLLFSGCRRGEICSLRWSDIDFDARTICINHAVSYTNKGLVIKTPKTISGNRTISLPIECINLLRQLCIKSDAGSEFVFVDRLSRSPFIPPQRITDRFRIIVDRHNASCQSGDELPYIRLHDLRHTAATLLISQNVDVETVARRLGHANPSITLNVYAHPTMEGDYRASKVMEEVLAV